jgi:hypothetical protein
MIQFFSCLMLYRENSNLTDGQFLYIDLGVLIPLCLFQEWTGAAKTLNK